MGGVVSRRGSQIDFHLTFGFHGDDLLSAAGFFPACLIFDFVRWDVSPGADSILAGNDRPENKAPALVGLDQHLPARAVKSYARLRQRPPAARFANRPVDLAGGGTSELLPFFLL